MFPPQDEFGKAADGVSSSSDTVGVIDFEKRKYPLLPQGVYPAICAKAEIKDANPRGEFYKPGDKRVHLRWQIQAPTYIDPEDEKTVRHYMAFSMPLGPAFGSRANLGKLWTKLTGADINDFKTETPMKLPMAGGKFKEIKRITFDAGLFMNMVCSVVIAHEEYAGEMRANLVNYMLDEGQRKTNYQQLPGMANVAPPPVAPAAPTQPMVNPADAFGTKNLTPAQEGEKLSADLLAGRTDPKDLPF